MKKITDKLLSKLANDKATLINPEIGQIEEVKMMGLRIVHTPTVEEIEEEKKTLREKKRLIAEKKKKRKDWEYIAKAKKPLFNRIKF